MTDYLKNNIVFRQSAAVQYAEFYKAKAFMLGEILETDKHKFTACARETLLQYFAQGTTWLMQMERMFIRLGRGLGKKERADVVATFASMERSVHTLIKGHPQDFDPKFAKIWIEVRENNLPYISSVLDKRGDSDMFEAFENLCDFLIGYLNHTLFSLHELDTLLKNSECAPFVYVDRIDLNVAQDSGFYSTLTRLDVYRQSGLLANKKVLIKHHVDNRYVNLTTERSEAHQLLLRSLSDYEIQYL